MKASSRRVPTIDERVEELLKDVPPLSDDQIHRAARLYLAATNSVQASNTDAA
jgi:hypothetical protein